MLLQIKTLNPDGQFQPKNFETKIGHKVDTMTQKCF